MSVDFTQPQRQSIIGIFVLFLYTLQSYAKALAPILVIWIFKFDQINKGYLVIGILLVLLIIGSISYLKYLNFTFFIDQENDEFIINEGIFNKTKTAVPLNKIQQVNINQSFIQRIVGVYELTVDTAGAQKKEGAIQAISHNLALDLKSRLLENEKDFSPINNFGNQEELEVKQDPAPFIEISFLSLLKIGITSNYLRSFLLLLAFFFTVSDYINKITGRDILRDEKIEDYVDTNAMIQAFFIGLVLLFCILLIINLVRIVFKYFNYKIAKQKGSLLLSYGLLNTKSTIIKPEKVQIITITRNFFQKKMNVLSLKIKQATSGEYEENNKSIIEIPGCNEQERDAIFSLLFEKIPLKGVMLKPNFRKLGFSVFLSIVLPLFAYFFLRDNIILQLTKIDYFVFVYAVFMGLIQFFKFKNNRIFINDSFIIRRSGAWDINNEIIEPSKIQAISTSQLFWHKSIDIGSVILHTAGGNIAFELGNFTKIKQCINIWLYEIETSNSNWM